MRAGEVYVNPASGERAVVVLGSEETAGKRNLVDLYLRPGGGMVGRHYHPSIHERFMVLDGQVSLTLYGAERLAEAGQVVDVPAGTWHDFGIPGQANRGFR